MALPKYLYADPLTILLNAEVRSCKGCAFFHADMGVKACDLKPREKQNRIRKCNLYANKRKEGDK